MNNGIVHRNTNYYDDAHCIYSYNCLKVVSAVENLGLNNQEIMALVQVSIVCVHLNKNTIGNS